MQRIEIGRQFKRGTVLEIQVRENDNRWASVSHGIFRSWSGPRRVDGVDYHGNVYYLDTNKIARSGVTAH